MSFRKDIVSAAAPYAVLGVAFYLMYRKAQATGALDPTNEKNLAYSAVNSIGASLTGNPNFNFGSWLNDINPLNAVARQNEAAAAGQYVIPSQGDIGSNSFPLGVESGSPYVPSSAAPPGFRWETLPNGVRTLVVDNAIDVTPAP